MFDTFTTEIINGCPGNGPHSPVDGVILCGEWRKHCPRLCPFHIHALTVYIQSGQGHVIRRGIANTQSMFRIAESQLFGRFTLLKRGKKNYGMISWI